MIVKNGHWFPSTEKVWHFSPPKCLKLKSHQSVLRAIQPHKDPMHKNTPSIEKLDFEHQIKEASPCEDWLQNIVLWNRTCGACAPPMGCQDDPSPWPKPLEPHGFVYFQANWSVYINNLQSTSDIPMLRFAPCGIHMRNRKAIHLETRLPTVHNGCHSPPSFRFCGLHNLASRCEIGKQITFRTHAQWP